MIRRLAITNFRCLQDVTVELGDLTALVGSNGTGKSSMLHALRFFFGAMAVDDADCWGNERERTIEVVIEIEPPAGSVLPRYVGESGRVWVARRSEPTGTDERHTYYVTRRLSYPPFADVRGRGNATEARAAYDELRGLLPDLPRWTNFPSLEGVLESWEEEHPEDLEAVEDQTVGFGTGQLDLAALVDAVFVPAVRSALDDAAAVGTSPLATVLRRLVDPTELFARQIDQMGLDLERSYSHALDAATPGLASARDAISERLDRFAPGTAVDLAWEGHAPAISIPGVRARLIEGGYTSDMGRQGHGTQRAYTLALLHALSDRGDSSDDTRPHILLMIEEPELYQHPTRARLLARVLRDLAASPSARTQVMFATHSPDFVGLEVLEAIRLCRLRPEADTPTTEVSSVDLEVLADQLWQASGSPGEPFTAESLRPRLRDLVSTPTASGLFARGVILVEGDEDAAIILAASTDAGVDFDQHNIALVPVRGKNNLDRPLLAFRRLGIPVYTMFDADASCRARERSAHARTNRRLLSLVGDPSPRDFPPTQVHETWACFQDTLATTVASEIGDGLWEEALANSAQEAGYPKLDHARKAPVIVGEAYGRIVAAGSRSDTLDAIMASLRALLIGGR